MKKFIIILILNTLFTGLFAQINKFGTPVSRSYSMQVTQGAEQNWAITKDIFGAIWFGGDESVVIRYDGTKWSKIPFSEDQQTVVRSLGSDENGIIFVGGSGEFGYIEPDSTGSRVYRSLRERFFSANDITSSFQSDTSTLKPVISSEATIGEIRSLIIKDANVYFLSPGTLIMYDIQRDSLSYVSLKSLGFNVFERIFLVNDKIILANNRQGLYELKDNKIVLLPGGDIFSYKMCLTILPYSKEKVIVATLNSGIFLYDYYSGTVNSEFIESKVSEKIKDLWIYCGVNLPSGEFALGTTSDGVYIFNENGQNTGHLASKTIDMKDDVVTALYADPDRNSELWISTTGTVTKAYVNIPFTQLSQKSGINGSVNNIAIFNGDVYVATDQGLYRSTTDEAGNRLFIQSNNLNAQIFALCVAQFGNESFMLAGTQFDGIYQIFPDGKSSKLNITSDPTRTIYQSNFRKSRFFIGLGSGFVYILDYLNGKWDLYAKVKGGDLGGLTSSYGELENGDMVLLSTYPDGLYKIPFNDSIPVKYTSDQGVPETGLNSIRVEGGNFILSTTNGLFKLNKANDRWESYDYITEGYTKNRNVKGTYSGLNGDLWIATSEDRNYDILFTRRGDSTVMKKGGALAVLPNLQYYVSSVVEGRIWLSKSSSIYVIDDSKLDIELPSVQTLLTRIVISIHGSDSIVMNETFFKTGADGKRFPVSSNSGQKPSELKYKHNSPSFYWTTPYLIEEEATLYSYKLDGFEDVWSNWVKVGYKDYTNLPFGKYTFRVKAKTSTEIESKEATYSFIILKPWYATPWMILLYAFAAILSVFGIIMAYTKRLKNENIRLEGIVAERTAVVVKQKEELESSIHYASRIQMALLPSESILSENIKNYFILFKPRDIVSGDFYWMTKKEERLYIVAADCTGHGVPGAFMSLLGMSFLDEIIDKDPTARANFILGQLRLHVTDSLKQVGGDDEAKDGMDMALLVIDFGTQRIEFSGAYNPCFKVRKLSEHEAAKYENDSAERPDGSMSNGRYLLETIYASKMPIGISSRMNEDFVFYDWILERGISYYMFSDGYIDQFGGDHGRKFMKKKFKRLLLEIQDYPMSKQKELLEKNLRDWMGQTPQIDDILVMGIRTE